MKKMIMTYGVLFYLSLVVFLWPLAQEYGELSLLDFSYASIIFFIIILIQFTLVSIPAFFRIVLNKSGITSTNRYIEASQYLMIAFFIALNIYYFCFTLLSLNRELEVYITFALMPLIFFLINNINRLKFVFLFSSIFLILSGSQFVFSYFSNSTEVKSQAVKWDLNKHQALFDLKERNDKRNIYLISFDAVASPDSLKKFYGIQTADHIEYLKSKEFRILDGAFSGGFNTRLSFFNMMKLGEDDAQLVPAFFSTRSLNPSYMLFEKLGYKIQFLFRGGYMGSNTQTLDYFYPEKSFITLCDFIDQQYGFVACNPGILRGIVQKNYETVPTLDEFVAKISNRTKVINSDDGSWITIAHIWFPGHAPHDFVYSNKLEKERFTRKIIDTYPRLAEMMEVLVNEIMESDDKPIIIIYSDHGAWLTKGLDYAQKNELYSSEEIFLEKNGVLFSVYPSSFCEETFKEGYSTVNLITDMLHCEMDK